MSIKEQIDEIKIIDGHVHAVDPWYWLQYVGSFPFADVASKLPPLGPMQMLNKKKTTLRGFKEIFDFPYDELTDENRPLMEKIYIASQEDEATFLQKAMDLAGIEKGLNICQSEPVIPPGLDPARFGKAQMVDGFLIPFDNSVIEGTARVKDFVKMIEVYPRILKEKSGVEIRTFDDYLNFMIDALNNLPSQGIIALKLNTAYWRDLGAEIVEKDEAEDVWNKKDNSPVRYKKLQDYLLRQMFATAAKLGLPTHIHTGALGITRPMATTNPTELDPLLWHPDVKPAKILMLHGAYPYCKEAGFMAGRVGDVPNCWLDFSMMTFFLPGSADSMKNIMKNWIISGIGDKLLYGSDGNNVLGTWMSAVNARRMLTNVFEELVQEGYLDEDQAVMFAKMLLRDNAKKLYQDKL